jgi:ATP-binding protein involved in chromosome partitioning
MFKKQSNQRSGYMAALSKVQEPELHKDLVTLNMIRDLQIDGGKVSFTLC